MIGLPLRPTMKWIGRVTTAGIANDVEITARDVRSLIGVRWVLKGLVNSESPIGNLDSGHQMACHRIIEDLEVAERETQLDPPWL